ncbi:MAG: hypothetical protein ACJ72W_03005 [Actinoallomurus sp.]
MDAVLATGPANAAGVRRVAHDGRRRPAPLARHWDGASWTEAALPAGLERSVTVARATGPRDAVDARAV